MDGWYPSGDEDVAKARKAKSVENRGADAERKYEK